MRRSIFLDEQEGEVGGNKVLQVIQCKGILVVFKWYTPLFDLPYTCAPLSGRDDWRPVELKYI